jgi:hypothetical protein
MPFLLLSDRVRCIAGVSEILSESLMWNQTLQTNDSLRSYSLPPGLKLRPGDWLWTYCLRFCSVLPNNWTWITPRTLPSLCPQLHQLSVNTTWRGLLTAPFLFLLAQQPLEGQSVPIIEASRLHSDTPHSVGLLWTGDKPDAETYTWRHTTLRRERHPCRRRDSKLQFQQAGVRRPTP